MKARSTVKRMPTQPPEKRPITRWPALKGAAKALLFLAIAILAEYLTISYAISLGLKDETPLQSNFKIPGTEWTFSITISPLFHLIPIAVIVSLIASWTYLSRRIVVRPQAVLRGKVGPVSRQVKKSKVDRFFSKISSALSRNRVITYLGRKIRSTRSTVRSALAILFVFLLFTLVASLLTYPELIYLSIVNAYRGSPSLLGFVKGVSNALSPIGQIFASANTALLGASPGFRDFASGFGGLIRPLADLDNVGKYLIIQNAAAWTSGLAALFYGEYRGQRYRVKK